MVEKFKIQNAKERFKLVRGFQVDDFPFEYGEFRFDVNLLGCKECYTHSKLVPLERTRMLMIQYLKFFGLHRPHWNGNPAEQPVLYRSRPRNPSPYESDVQVAQEEKGMELAAK